MGIFAGLGGIAVTLVLHGTQHLLFGYDTGTFLQGIEAAPGWRRVAGAAAGGLVVGLGWAALRRTGRPPTVGDALGGAALPIDRTGPDALLQAVAVGGGASVGREGAPRQLGGTAGALLADRLGLDPGDRRVATAAGAGAGLAAVYNVPLAGVLFAVLALGAGQPSPRAAPARGRVTDRLRTVGRAAVPALRAGDWLVVVLACGVATVTAWTVLGSGRVYVLPPGVPDQGLSIALVVWAVVAAPVAAAAAVTLDAVARRAMARPATGPIRTPLATTAAMGLVGLAAVWWPSLPGNGKGVIELTLGPPAALRDGVLLAGAAPAGWTAAAAFVLLAALKIVLTGICLRAGIVGGLLTPALAVGSALGAAAAAAADVPASVPEWAMIGAVGVLAVSHRSAVFAAVMVWELTGLPWPVVAAAAGTGALARLWIRAAARR